MKRYLFGSDSGVIGTTLSGLTFYLLTNQDKLDLLIREIRSKFRGEGDIGFQSVAELKYLNACKLTTKDSLCDEETHSYNIKGIKEAMRLYPPVPVGVPRVVPNAASGQKMPGGPVPAGTRVSVHHYATCRTPFNFRNPDNFVPERWLGDPAYSSDHLDGCRPFAFGPRDCLGQSMALREMQLIAARLFFKFNVEMIEGNTDWDKQRAFVLWEKKPLMCRLTLAS